MADLAHSPDEQPAEEVEITVENVGGIDRQSHSIPPGITVLAGRNATNRTSFLTAISGILGGSKAALKTDAEEGNISMEIGDESYSTEYIRTAEGVRSDGTTFSDESGFVDLFVSLLEDNPTRRAVERGDDLREIIMRPVDTEAIESRISALRTEIAELDEQIEWVESRRSELPRLDDRRRSLEEEISALDTDIADLQEEVSEAEQELETKEGSSEIIDALERRRTERNDIASKLEVKRAERNALLEEIEEIEDELDVHEDVSTDDVQTLEQDLHGARERKREIDETVTSLTTIVELNEDLLEGDLSLSGINVADDDVTSQLIADTSQEVDCWTCGSRVEGEVIEERLNDLREIVREKRSDRRELSNTIDDLQERIARIRDTISRRETLADRLEGTREKIESLETEISSLEDDFDECERNIADLEDELAEAEADRGGDLSTKYEEISDLEFERGRVKQELEDVEDEIEEIEGLSTVEDLAQQRRELRSELEDLQDRISSLESSAVEAFNTHMDELLDVLDYENIARVWIERKQIESRESTRFDIHVVRESSDSTVYEDVLTNLSESEREVIGLVVALAGYLVHEVYETVPFILLDSLESIDAERIGLLVDYFSAFADYLIVALLPEDASTLEDRHPEIVTKNFG